MIRIEYAFDANGRQPAQDFLDRLEPRYQQRFYRLFEVLQQHGRIKNYTEFKKLGPEACSLWEFKVFQARLFGDFRPGGRFIVAGGTIKKNESKNGRMKREIETACRVLAEHDRREA